MVGLLGHKLKHSLSKKIHESIVPSRPYQLVEKSSIDEFMVKKEFEAINVTIPYKEAVIPYCDKLDPLAKSLHSVNTIVNRNGLLIGYNTDYQGLLDLLHHFNIRLADQNVAILGNGASSSMVAALAKEQNAKSIKHIVRTLKSTDDILVDTKLEMDEIDVIINTTPVGMYPSNHAKPFVDLSKFPNARVAIDLIYNPLQTSFLLEAKKRGMKTINGLYMLVAQAFYAEEIFLNRKLDVTIIGEVYHNVLLEQTNIVLIGMPTSGKSTIGKFLAFDLKRPFYDIDTLIEETFGSITQIFAEHGEDKFREYETLTLEEVSKYQGAVISTGGGIIKHKLNMDYLSQNGIIIYINRDIDILMHQDFTNRPLLRSQLDLKMLFEQRNQLYLDYCDIMVDNNSTFANVITTIKEKVYEIISH
jgi:shikimate dehydrogenase